MNFNNKVIVTRISIAIVIILLFYSYRDNIDLLLFYFMFGGIVFLIAIAMVMALVKTATDAYCLFNYNDPKCKYYAFGEPIINDNRYRY